MGNAVPWYSTILLGFGTVFVGLICLIYIIKLMGVIVGAIEKKNALPAVPAAAPDAAQAAIPDRGAFSAAVAASIATVMGKDVSGLRILSIKKI